MEAICGADCNNCGYGKNLNCKGCKESKGCPFANGDNPEIVVYKKR